MVVEMEILLMVLVVEVDGGEVEEVVIIIAL